MSRYVGCVAILAVILVTGIAVAHGGGTDKYGGHNNRKTGGYHYHNAGRVHHPSNPYQNHETCGVCRSSTRSSTSSAKSKPTAESALVVFTQASLTLLGYDVDIDGRFGPETTRQLKSFQQKHGLPITGHTDDQTFLALLGDLEADKAR